MSGDEQNLNPQIRSVEIGVRDLRKISIFPMSMSDQAKFTDLLQEALNVFFEQAPGGDLNEENLLPLFASLGKLVSKNSQEFIKIVTDKDQVDPKEFFDEVTNTQMSVIIGHIITDNYEEPSKNALSLFQTIKSLFQWERLLPTSSNDIVNTTLDTSTQEDGEKED
jgi:hypothetical protein